VGDDDGVLFGEVVDEVLDFRGGDGVQRRGRLVHQDDLRVGGYGTGDTEPLLLAAREVKSRRTEPVVHLVPRRRVLQRLLDAGVDIAVEVLDLQPVGDVLADALGERIGLLEHHANPAAQRDGVDVVVVDVLATQQELALDAGGVDEVVHPVDAPQERRLSAAGRSDERRHLLFGYLEGDVVQRLRVVVPDVDGPGLDDGPARAGPGTSAEALRGGLGDGVGVGLGRVLEARDGSRCPVRLRWSTERSPVLNTMPAKLFIPIYLFSVTRFSGIYRAIVQTRPAVRFFSSLLYIPVEIYSGSK
jgi:hypothetical protein